MVLAALICYSNRATEVKARFADAKEKAAKFGANPSLPKFEFHAYDLCSKSGFFKDVPYDNRLKMAQVIKKAVTVPRLSCLAVKIDKRENGINGVRRFQNYVDTIRKDFLNNLSIVARKNLEDLIVASGDEKRGVGQLRDIIGLFFGLTTGLLHREGFRGNAEVIIDKQFLKGVKNWNVVFGLSKTTWPFISKLRGFPGWPESNQPDWHLGETPEIGDSYKHFGLQLADFVAYKAKRMHKFRDDTFDSLTVITAQNFKPFYDYQGISIAALSYGLKPSERKVFPSWRNASRYIFRKT